MDTDNISGIFNSSIRNNDSRRSWPLSPILSATRGKLSTPQPPLLLSTGTMAGMATEAAAAAQLSHNLPPSPNSPTFGGAPIIPCSTSQQWTMLGGPTTSHLTPQPSPGRTQAYPALFPPVTTTSPTHSTALAFRGRPSSPSVWSEPIGPHAASPFPLVRRDSAPVQIRELSKEACEWGAVRPYSLSKHNSSFEGDKFLRATASLPFEALSSVDQAFSSESGANRTPVFRTNAVGRAESAVEHPRGRRAPPSEGCNGSHTGSSAAGAVVPSQCYGGGPVPTPAKAKAPPSS
ncbi:hypothetical protein DFJ73DRAFT_538343 [Zopfochytrium polystomum]|nr:hypothetical protein DFJ73DRAFT_538343 [Zopfochytrium polystomum]